MASLAAGLGPRLRTGAEAPAVSASSSRTGPIARRAEPRGAPVRGLRGRTAGADPAPPQERL